MIEFDRATCTNLAVANRREWLETNGLGGFASSTITGLNTRRYHSLLIAATTPPTGRTALLSKLEETLIVGEKRFELSCNQYPGVVYPQGYNYLKRFRLDPFPVFTYEVEGVEMEKSLFMVHGENTTVIEYKLRDHAPGNQECRIEIRSLVSFRNYHSTTHENQAINREVKSVPGLASLALYTGLPTLHLAHNATAIGTNGEWYRRFQYEVEHERGLDYEEDLFNPCVLFFNLDREKSAVIIASTEIHTVASAGALHKQELARRKSLTQTARLQGELLAQLTGAADQFIAARGENKTVMAGYHWFTDWGRDTMISLPGLTLATGRFEIAKNILLEFSYYVDRGMLPNRFPDSGEIPEYNTVDATLWYFEAVRAYLEATGDELFVRDHLYPVLVDIIGWHIKGTRYDIHVDEDGLLNAGTHHTQLTWMDAQHDNQCITPRNGKPVEIQALWYNALRTMEAFAARFDAADAGQRFERLAALSYESFNRLFWNEKSGCLFDVIGSAAPDASIRPNQVFAVSLPHPILEPAKFRNVLDVVERDLLTPYGLRTLSPADARYKGRYGGDQRARDDAYHQGTVWPWLLGPFITAWLKVYGESREARDKAAGWIGNFEPHLRGAGLGQISEIFDGDPPHAPHGCIAQAWSVAELLRVAALLQTDFPD
ncbi:MAG TPA: amylo-alpha-1,6-glucosidase [Terriglobales bacterium]|jgi:predicted glycogen debranching enzyme|nr:amylo-alpha-1,6-glucosidase [Terriglobales bacterium]